MPRFFFDLQDFSDSKGAELADERAVRSYALRLAGEIIRDMTIDDHELYWRMDVRQGGQDSFMSLVFETVVARPAEGGGRRDPSAFPARGEQRRLS